MADPLSIATGSLALAQLAALLSKNTYQAVQATKDADNDVQALATELRILSASWDSVGNTLKQPGFQQDLFATSVSNEATTRLATIQPIIDDCDQSLKQLQQLYDQIQGSGRNTLLPRKTSVALKLNLKNPKVEKIRQQLRNFQSVLQVELHLLDM